MTPTSSRGENNFDLLRIAAAVQVLLLHGFWHLEVDPPPGWFVLEAFPGVPIFFVISGFLISRSFERSTSLFEYARNRALRIYPALWTCLALTVLVASLAGFSFAHREGVAWASMQAIGLIYTPGFLSTFGFGSYNGSLWTIPIELQFYLLVPVVYAFLRPPERRFESGLKLMLVVFIAIALAFVLLSPQPVEGVPEPLPLKLARYTFLPHFYLFLAGTLLQRLRVEDRAWVAGRGAYWAVFYLTLRLALPKNGWTDTALTLLLAICVVSVAFTVPRLSRRLLRGNDVSYGVYIYHGLLINLFLSLGWRSTRFAVAFLLVTTVAMGWLSWRLVERPALGRKRPGSRTARAS